MNGLSIDPNTGASGLVFWRNEAPVRAQTVFAARRDWLAMVHNITATTQQYERRTGVLEWVAIEGIYQGPNPQTYEKLAKLLGCLEYFFYDSAQVYVLSTREIDRACGLVYRSGNRKRATGKLASHELPGCDEHQADAYCVGLAGWGAHKMTILLSTNE